MKNNEAYCATLCAHEDHSQTGARDEAADIAAQLGRAPRAPWRVGARCTYGFPTVIISPSLLDDGQRFPNYAYLTCPHLVKQIARLESSGAISEYARQLAQSEEAAQAQRALDASVRAARLAECRACSQEEDACASVGLAGQRDPLGVKCLHIHAAYALLGFNDEIGVDVLARLDAQGGRECA